MVEKAETLEAIEEEEDKLCGIDEAGRGPLAGPLVVAGVVLLEKIEGLNDSKKLTSKRREELYKIIIKNSKYKIIFIDNQTIDEIGLSKVIKNSLEELKEYFLDYKIIFDGNTSFGVSGIKTLVKADQLIPSVSAASILAKVSRDRYMVEIDGKYPQYNFKKHKGYGTKEHIKNIEIYGLSPLHRKSFKVKR